MQLEGKLQAQNIGECDNNLHAQINNLRKELDEKTDAMQDLESLNCVLTVKERMTNQELQDARKETVEVWLYSFIFCTQLTKNATNLPLLFLAITSDFLLGPPSKHD